MKLYVRGLAIRCLAILCMVASSNCVWVCANENFFLPGDAFFSVEGTKESIQKWISDKDADRRFQYKRFDKVGGSFCGTAGYRFAIIPSVDDAFLKNLQLVYDEVRKVHGRQLHEFTSNGRVVLQETNGIKILFYPEDSDFREHIIGLAYNEDWVEQIEKFGHKREHIQLDSQLKNADAIAVSWRDSKVVPGLRIRLPSHASDSEEEPAPVEVIGEVRALVVGSGTLDELFYSESVLYHTLYVVSSDGYEQWEKREGEWSRTHSKKNNP